MHDYYIAVIRQPQNMATYKWVLAIFHSLLYNEWVIDRQFNNDTEFGGGGDYHSHTKSNTFRYLLYVGHTKVTSRNS